MPAVVKSGGMPAVLAPNAALRAQIVPGEPDQLSVPAEAESETPSASTRARLSWAQWLKRVFQIDMASCLHCGGPVTLIAAIEDPAVIAKILAYLGLRLLLLGEDAKVH